MKSISSKLEIHEIRRGTQFYLKCPDCESLINERMVSLIELSLDFWFGLENIFIRKAKTVLPSSFHVTKFVILIERHVSCVNRSQRLSGKLNLDSNGNNPVAERASGCLSKKISGLEGPLENNFLLGNPINQIIFQNTKIIQPSFEQKYYFTNIASLQISIFSVKKKVFPASQMHPDGNPS
jgi:hypothetical protein